MIRQHGAASMRWAVLLLGTMALSCTEEEASSTDAAVPLPDGARDTGAEDTGGPVDAGPAPDVGVCTELPDGGCVTNRGEAPCCPMVGRLYDPTLGCRGVVQNFGCYPDDRSLPLEGCGGPAAVGCAVRSTDAGVDFWWAGSVWHHGFVESLGAQECDNEQYGEVTGAELCKATP